MGNLVLIVEHQADARRLLRRRLEASRYEPVEAASARAALELIQRLPKSFRLVLVQLEMPDLPGAALIETLRLCQPHLPVICIGPAEQAAVTIGCPLLSDHGEELESQLRLFESRRDVWKESSVLPDPAVRRVRASYQRTSDLVEAAYEVARQLPPAM